MSEFEKWYGSNFGDPYDAPKDRYKAMQEAFKAGALTARSEGFTLKKEGMTEGVEWPGGFNCLPDEWRAFIAKHLLTALSPRETDTEQRQTTPAENLRILRARLAENLSPAEERELEDAAALLSKVGQGWVPVSERLPEEGVTVMIAVFEVPLFAGPNAIPVYGFNLWYRSKDGWGRRNVTHWMPLPPPPDRP